MFQFKYMRHGRAARSIYGEDFEVGVFIFSKFNSSVTKCFVKVFGRTFTELLGAQGECTTDLESFRDVLCVGIDRLAENLS